MRVITNNQPRRLHLLAAMQPRVQQEFGYVSVTDNTPRMVLYKNVWYDIYDSQTTSGLPADNPLRAWDLLVGESFFSGVVFRHTHLHDYIVCGRYVA